MINPQVDEQSMMTYLSQYPNARIKPGAPVRSVNHADQVRCYGLGLEPTGHKIDKPAIFHIETCAAGVGDVDVVVIDPNGQTEEVQTKSNLFSHKDFSFFFKSSVDNRIS